MISEKQIYLASTAINFLQKKGAESYQAFMQNNAEQIGALQAKTSDDKGNFSIYSRERRALMLSKFAAGMIYFSMLSDEERALVIAESQKQYSRISIVDGTSFQANPNRQQSVKNFNNTGSSLQRGLSKKELISVLNRENTDDNKGENFNFFLYTAVMIGS